MQNQINTQYLPQGNYNQYQMTPQTPVCQASGCYPTGPSVGAVNIQITIIICSNSSKWHSLFNQANIKTAILTLQ